MPGIFNLENVAILVKQVHPSRILILDTNIIMNSPEPDEWNVQGQGRNLFVLSDILIQELEFIRRKKVVKEKAESIDSSIKAIKNLANLFNKGKIAEGIKIESGWVISIATPRRDLIKPELDQFDDLVQAFGASDIKYFLLTRECHELFKSIPVTFITGETNLNNIIQSQGLPCHLSANFPIVDLKEATALIKPINWDKELEKLQENMQEQSISVELTLTSKKSTPKWLASSDGPSELMIAEGFGVIYDGGNTRSFLWTVHFSPWTLKAEDVDTSNQSNIPSVYLDFLGEHDFNSKISDDIKDKLLECLYLSFEVPILQDPKSIMEMGIFFEYDSSTIPTDNKLEQLNQSVEEAEGLIYYWAEWIMKKTHVDDQCACLCFLLNLLDNYWRIGQKYTFKIMR